MIIGIVIGVVVLCLLILAGISVRIVREYQRIVLFRLGRALGTRAVSYTHLDVYKRQDHAVAVIRWFPFSVVSTAQVVTVACLV